MQRDKKKLFLVFTVAMLVLLICSACLRMDSPVIHSMDRQLQRVSLDEGSTVVDFTDFDTLSFLRGFYICDEYREFSLDIKATVYGDNLYVVIYDVTDIPYTQETRKLKEVYRETISKDGNYKIDLLQFPKERQYVIGVFCDEKTMFAMHEIFSWKVSMKDYLADEFSVKVFKHDSQYDPDYMTKYAWCK